MEWDRGQVVSMLAVYSTDVYNFPIKNFFKDDAEVFVRETLSRR